MAVKTGIGIAKHKKCINCPGHHFMLSPPARHGQCRKKGFRADGTDAPEQNADYYDNLQSTCPMGYWGDLEPVDLEARATEGKAAAISRETEAMKKFLDILSPDEKTGDAIRAKVEALSDANIIRHPETAAALEAYVDERPTAIEG